MGLRMQFFSLLCFRVKFYNHSLSVSHTHELVPLTVLDVTPPLPPVTSPPSLRYLAVGLFVPLHCRVLAVASSSVKFVHMTHPHLVGCHLVVSVTYSRQPHSLLPFSSLPPSLLRCSAASLPSSPLCSASSPWPPPPSSLCARRWTRPRPRRARRSRSGRQPRSRPSIPARSCGPGATTAWGVRAGMQMQGWGQRGEKGVGGHQPAAGGACL